MKQKEVRILYEEYFSDAELAANDAALLQAARAATGHAYAPYSGFRVGAAARLLDGRIITGTNQENASFPAGICAERTLLSAVATQFPGMGIEAIAISYHNEHGESDRPVSPCGICRQTMQEFEQRMGGTIRLILGGGSGPVFCIEPASALLPLAFTSDELL